jgi:hypothetical protein
LGDHHVFITSEVLALFSDFSLLNWDEVNQETLVESVAYWAAKLLLTQIIETLVLV